MIKRLAAITLLLSASAFAQCTQPTIQPSLSSPSVTVTYNTPADGDVTFAWTTDVASDTACFVALNGGGTPDQYDLPKGVGYWWDTSGATDLTGVTSHTCTVHGVRPGWTIAYNVRSRCVSGGAPVLDQAHTRFAYEVDNGQTSTWSPVVTTPAIITTDPATYSYVDSGGQTIYNGYGGLFVGFRTTPLSGADTSMTATLSGVPSCMTSTFVGYTAQYASGNVITTSPTNGRDHGFNVRLTASGCPTGNYTITESYTFSPSGVTGSSSHTVTVANLPTFPAGTPSSYPTIPCWQAGSKMTDGITSCTQTFDATLVNTEAVYWAGNISVGGIYGGCASTTPNPVFAISSNGDQWPEYYDGAWDYNNLADYVTKYPASTTQPASFFQTAAKNCGDAYYSSAATIGYNQVPGRWLFARGAVQNYQRYADSNASTFLTQEDAVGAYLPTFATWQNSYTWEYIDDANLREITYACDWQLEIHNFNGKNTATQIQWCTDMLLGYLDQAINRLGTLEQGFFDGLAADTLIRFYADPYTGADARIPVVLAALAVHMNNPANHIWNPTSTNQNAWCLNCRKTDIGMYQGSEQSLNLMAVHISGWLFRNTGDTTYQTFGDNAFQYGVLGYSRNHGKELSEILRSGIKYITDDRTTPASIRQLNRIFGTGRSRVSGGGKVQIH
jgi:hypothetical protein